MCASPRKGAPARIHFCFIDAESVDVQAEIASVAQQVVAPLGLSGLARMQREADVVGAILGRMRAMARGQLPEGNPSRPVAGRLPARSLRASLEVRQGEECGGAGLSR